MKISAELGWALCLHVLLLRFMLRLGLNSLALAAFLVPIWGKAWEMLVQDCGKQIVRVSGTHTTALSSSIPLLMQVEDTENCYQEDPGALLDDPDMCDATRRINLYMNS